MLFTYSPSHIIYNLSKHCIFWFRHKDHQTLWTLETVSLGIGAR